MTQRVLCLPDDHDAWLAAWRSLPDDQRDVHAHPDFVALHTGPGVRAMCVLAEDTRGLAMLPALACDLPAALTGGEALCDLQGCPGYNGVFASSPDRGLLTDLDAGLAAWGAAHGVIAEFHRLNPLIPGEPPEGYRVVESNRNIAIDLAPGPEAIQRDQYDYAVRKQLAKAGRAGLTFGVAREGAAIDEAYAVYAHTMDRNAATSRQPRSYFAAAAALSDDLATFYTVSHQGRVVACELVTHGARIAYSYLGGTMADAFPLAPNEFLKHGIVADMHARGRRWFLLGGGLAPEDGIHRYKRKFSPANDLPFRFASRVRDPARFAAVVERWAAGLGAEAERHRGKALPYRFP